MGAVAHVHKLNTQKAEAVELWVQDQPGLHSEFQISLHITASSCLKQIKRSVT
jgi:hypothetical protein